MKHKIENNLIDIQSDIINAFESLESQNDSIISLDEWKREEGGGGKTFVIENGSFFDTLVGLWWAPPPKIHQRPIKDPAKIQHKKNEENIDCSKVLTSTVVYFCNVWDQLLDANFYQITCHVIPQVVKLLFCYSVTMLLARW